MARRLGVAARCPTDCARLLSSSFVSVWTVECAYRTALECLVPAPPAPAHTARCKKTRDSLQTDYSLHTSVQKPVHNTTSTALFILLRSPLSSSRSCWSWAHVSLSGRLLVCVCHTVTAIPIWPPGLGLPEPRSSRCSAKTRQIGRVARDSSVRWRVGAARGGIVAPRGVAAAPARLAEPRPSRSSAKTRHIGWVAR